VSAANDVQAALRAAGGQTDDEVDLAVTALLLAALDQPEASLQRYRDHLAELVRDTAALAKGQADLPGRAAVLGEVLFGRHGYAGDTQTYDDMQNANLMRVIDRRKGLPVALGILLLHAARAQGWTMHGLNFPGHFLLRLERASERLVIDPFDQAKVVGTFELRQLLKRMAGPEAELDPQHYRPMGNREILLRLQNNIKTRALGAADNERAAAVLRSMLLLAPDHAPSWREFALLEGFRGNLHSALGAVEQYRRHAPDERGRRDAAMLLRHFRSQLN